MRRMPGPLSLAPAAVAIALALATRRVIPSLLAGVFVATLVLAGGHPWAALVRVVDPLVVDAIADRDHVRITIFSLLIAAAVELLGVAGATDAFVAVLTRRARTRRGGMRAAWGAGLAVFFDDYANCLVVGNAMRPVADRLGISREKLAYLVDTTAAPMATIALLSTWVGYEVGLMGDALRAAGQDTGRYASAYAFFLDGWAWRTYPILALVFAGAIAWTGRDFGPMLAAERRARRAVGKRPRAEAGHPWLAATAAVVVAALVGVTALSLWFGGRAAAPPGARLFEIVGAADAYDAMLRGSIAALALALLLLVGGRALAPDRAIAAVLDGMRALLEPLVVLFLAWALSSAMGQLDAATWLAGLAGEAVPPAALPTVVFVLAAAISFATGTSFGTMGVLMPLAIPLAFQLAPDHAAIPVATGAAVLSGATWGDHCSPISDTTVLSSTGSGCDHAAHVATQLPYALAVGGLSIVFGTIPAGLGWSPWPFLGLGALAAVALVRFLGRRD